VNDLLSCVDWLLVSRKWAYGGYSLHPCSTLRVVWSYPSQNTLLRKAVTTKRQKRSEPFILVDWTRVTERVVGVEVPETSRYIFYCNPKGIVPVTARLENEQL
jgi:hypothetical protein